MGSTGNAEEATAPLLDYSSKYEENAEEHQSLSQKVWMESKKLWHIVGPEIFSRIATYSMFVITIAFADHLGDLELAAMSISCTVVLAFNFGFMLGMASALETLCGQAYGAKKYHMLGVYLQRSCIVLFLCCILLLPIYIFASPILKLLGQPLDVAELSGFVALRFIPLHFSYAFQFPLQRFLQCQLKTAVIAWVKLVALVVHVAFSWLFVYGFKFGLVRTVVTLNLSWWALVFGLIGYTVFGGCPLTWTGFSMEAFSGLWEFVKLSASSGVMLCMNINGWEMMIPLAFFAGTGVRVANELGAGNGKGAKFSTIVSVATSIVIGLFFWLLIMNFHNEIALIFSSSKPVLEAVNKLSILLAFTILLNSVQPVLSEQYYMIGIPLGVIMGWVLDQGVMGIWAGMIFGGTALQTLVLMITTIRCDWEKEAKKARTHVKKWSDRN